MFGISSDSATELYLNYMHYNKNQALRSNYTPDTLFMVDLSGNLPSLQIVTNIPLEIIQGNSLSTKDAYHTCTNSQQSTRHQIEYLAQPQQFIFQPLLAMIKVFASESIITTKETSTYDYYTDVIVRGGLPRDQRLSSLGHCVTPVTTYC